MIVIIIFLPQGQNGNVAVSLDTALIDRAHYHCQHVTHLIVDCLLITNKKADLSGNGQLQSGQFLGEFWELLAGQLLGYGIIEHIFVFFAVILSFVSLNIID